MFLRCRLNNITVLPIKYDLNTLMSNSKSMIWLQSTFTYFALLFQVSFVPANYITHCFSNMLWTVLSQGYFISCKFLFLECFSPPHFQILDKAFVCFLGGSNLPSAELQKYFKPLTKLLQYISKYAYVGLCLTSQLDDTVIVAKSVDSEASEGDMNHAYVIY